MSAPILPFYQCFPRFLPLGPRFCGIAMVRGSASRALDMGMHASVLRETFILDPRMILFSSARGLRWALPRPGRLRACTAPKGLRPSGLPFAAAFCCYYRFCCITGFKRLPTARRLRGKANFVSELDTSRYHNGAVSISSGAAAIGCGPRPPAAFISYLLFWSDTYYGISGQAS